jgi:hypothetical protein
MRTFRIIGALAMTAVVMVGCEDITNPVEEFGEFAPAWVGFEAPRAANGSHGTATPVIYGALTTRPEEDVQIDITFGGTAVFGEDYMIVDASGSPISGITAAGGTLLIEADPAREGPQDTLWIAVPTDATVGSTVIIEMSEARTVDGDPIAVGYLGQWTEFELTVIPGPADITEGTYSGEVSGDFGAGPIPPVTITESPVTIGGTQYRYQISDFSYGLFGVAIPWAFNVYSDGSVEFSPSAVGFNVTADVTGSYDLADDELTMDVTLTCCGAAGASWTALYTAQ